MEEAGYPKRHIQHIRSMHGEGLAKAKSLQERIKNGDCLLVLCGDRGPGKTQIATYWAHKRVISNKHPGQYLKAHDLIEAIKSSFDGDAKMKAEAKELLRKVKRTGFLVLDEFSELQGTDWELRTLTNIIDHRYDNMLTTIIITNMKPAEAGKALGRSIWSRAEETGGIVECNWPSYRGREHGE